MHANATSPIRMEHVAQAAGCSVRTLDAVFRHFRDTTPLAALHAIRLEQVQAELSHSAIIGSPAEVARRYGFTNAGRFTAAYRRRFGEAPLETARRGARVPPVDYRHKPPTPGFLLDADSGSRAD